MLVTPSHVCCAGIESCTMCGVQEVPLLNKLLLSGNPTHVAERGWLLRLMIAGLRGPGDGSLYR
jgi:hypothetical protein